MHNYIYICAIIATQPWFSNSTRSVLLPDQLKQFDVGKSHEQNYRSSLLDVIFISSQYLLARLFNLMEDVMTLTKRLGAEFIGTFWLVLGGCGSAVLAAKFPEVGIGLLGVAFAFGLTVLTMVFAFGYISGGHFNPAVSFGLMVAGRFKAADFIPYVIAQVIGGAIAALVLYYIASGQPGFDIVNGLANNGYGEHSPGHYSIASCFVTEVIMTFMFLIIILGATDERAPKGFAALAIGLGLTLIHLISIPITNTSVNPARSTGPALVVGGWALAQLWFFWIAPLIGALLAGITYRWLGNNKQ